MRRGKARGKLSTLGTAVLAACLLTAVPGPAPANVFGEDDRRLLTETDGLSAVGLVVCEGTTRRPTAVLVRPGGADPGRHFDIVVTVAHAFLGHDDEPLAQCAFWPGGEETDAAPIVFVAYGTLRPPADWGADWAVAVLDRRLAPRYRPLETRVMSQEEALEMRTAGKTFLLAGHNGEIGPLMISDRCGPMRKGSGDANLFDGRVFNHDCDMMPGWSGGPMIAEIDGRPYVVAVNATELNAVATQFGAPYDGRFTANTAVRIDGAFWETIHRLSRSGPPERLAATGPACGPEMAGPTPREPC